MLSTFYSGKINGFKFSDLLSRVTRRSAAVDVGPVPVDAVSEISHLTSQNSEVLLKP